MSERDKWFVSIGAWAVSALLWRDHTDYLQHVAIGFGMFTWQTYWTAYHWLSRRKALKGGE